jgi:hypothetical protein
LVIGDPVGAQSLGSGEQPLQALSPHRIVGIEKGDPGADRSIERAIARSAHAAVPLQRDRLDAPVLGCKALDQAPRAVRRAVVYDDNFDIRERLSHRRAQTRLKRGLGIISGYDDGNSRHGSYLATHGSSFT